MTSNITSTPDDQYIHSAILPEDAGIGNLFPVKRLVFSLDTHKFFSSGPLALTVRSLLLETDRFNPLEKVI